jgi:vacuolar-type H+-ATPase subunit I/STV1
MSFLKDVSVSRISFVKKAANLRKFLLLKAAVANDDIDVVDVVDVVNKNDNKINKINEKNEKEESYKPMRKEVKEAFLAIVKNAVVPDNLVELLKADTTLKITDAEIVEVNSYADVIKSVAPEKTEKTEKVEKAEKTDNTNNKDSEKTEKMEKSEVNNEKLLKQVEDLTTKLETITKSAQRRDIVSFLEHECPFLTEDIQKTADLIVSLESASPEAAESFKTSLKKASALMENSPVLTEFGSSTDEFLKSEAESDGFSLIKKFDNAITNLKKSADGGNAALKAEDIVRVIKGFGKDYVAYRDAHIHRAKVS